MYVTRAQEGRGPVRITEMVWVKKDLEYKTEEFIVDAVNSGEPPKNLQTA